MLRYCKEVPNFISTRTDVLLNISLWCPLEICYELCGIFEIFLYALKNVNQNDHFENWKINALHANVSELQIHCFVDPFFGC